MTYDNRDHFNLAVPFKVVDDATFEVVGAFSSLGGARTTPTKGARPAQLRLPMTATAARFH